MSYRPITDVWFLARAKLKGGKKYYGAYLGGFPERARALLGCRLNDPVLHVCGGCARDYPYRRGFGPNDRTLICGSTIGRGTAGSTIVTGTSPGKTQPTRPGR